MLKSVKMHLGKSRNVVSSHALTFIQSRARAKGQRSIVVVGARRSGHHAVISWLANSLEAQQVEWNRVGASQCFIGISRRSVHLNAWRLDRDNSASWQTFRSRHLLRSADFLFVNYEDVDPLTLDRHIWFPNRSDLKVAVRRSTLNLAASRLKMSEERANRSFLVDEPFLDVLLGYRRDLPDWLVIDFDRWLRNEDGYRTSIAERAGITSGDDPHLSVHGDGSSFTGRNGLPELSELTNRFTQVEWPEHVVKLLLDEKYSTLLTGEERDFLQSQ